MKGSLMRRVLILCTGNSCRSQMAEAIINHERPEEWQAVSAGTRPADQAHPKALVALAEIGIHTDGSKPQHVDDFKGETFDAVITVCDDAADNCPVWIGEGVKKHIGFPDPAHATGTEEEVMAVFRQVRDDIHAQILDYLDTNF
jgi:arsenate reductase